MRSVLLMWAGSHLKPHLNQSGVNLANLPPRPTGTADRGLANPLSAGGSNLILEPQSWWYYEDDVWWKDGCCWHDVTGPTGRGRHKTGRMRPLAQLLCCPFLILMMFYRAFIQMYAFTFLMCMWPTCFKPSFYLLCCPCALKEALTGNRNGCSLTFCGPLVDGTDCLNKATDNKLRKQEQFDLENPGNNKQRNEEIKNWKLPEDVSSTKVLPSATVPEMTRTIEGEETDESEVKFFGVEDEKKEKKIKKKKKHKKKKH